MRGWVVLQWTLGPVVLCGLRDVIFLKATSEKGERMADDKEKPAEKKNESAPANLPTSGDQLSESDIEKAVGGNTGGGSTGVPSSRID